MKRAVLGAMTLAVLMATAGLSGCGKNDENPKVDPKLDGLSGPKASADPTIFDNQAEIYRKMHPAPPPPPPPPAATAPAGEATTAPGEGAPAPEAAPAAPGDNAPPPPPG